MHQAHDLQLSGPAGGLEACLRLPGAGTAGVAVLCHPHPQYGGSMHDAVLQTLELELLNHGWACLRFNFRGVGRSAGTFDQGQGEQDDVLAVLAAVRDAAELSPVLSADCRTQPPLLCGYSFGAAMAWHAQSRAPRPLFGLWLAAPPLSIMPLPAADPGAPTQVFLGDHDTYCSVADAQRWLQSLPGLARLSLIAGADHFFTGQQVALGEAARALLDSQP